MRYPNKIRKENLNSIINYKNRGMSLENALNITIKYLTLCIKKVRSKL